MPPTRLTVVGGRRWGASTVSWGLAGRGAWTLVVVGLPVAALHYLGLLTLPFLIPYLPIARLALHDVWRSSRRRATLTPS